MHTPHIPHKEPEDIFLPLNPARYAEFYSLEMDHFSSDIQFYQEHIADSSTVLELGCGTGRISRNLSQNGINVTGIDLSPEMLQLAAKHDKRSTRYICMDMCQMAFSQKFDHILIPYNTLNLLKTESQILKCLKLLYEFLKTDGTLLFQIYLPTQSVIEKNENEKLFQFQIFSLPDNKGKLIKESIRFYKPNDGIFSLEERYRVRPSSSKDKKEDLHHRFQLAGFSFEKWNELIYQSHFKVTSLFSNYDGSSFDRTNDSRLLAILRK